MELAAINSPLSAFVAGLVTSLHCAGMCGPLSCSLVPGGGDRSDPRTAIAVYHLCRLGAYAFLGALAGGIGRVPLLLLSSSVLQWVPWALVLVFVALAFRWDRYLPKIAALNRFSLALHTWMRSRSRTAAAAALGLGTPLLPCGPLYFVLSLGLLSGSWLRGAEQMLAFGLGTVPLLWVVQTHFRWMRENLPPIWLGRLRIVLGLSVAAIVGWRLRATLGFDGPNPLNFVCF